MITRVSSPAVATDDPDDPDDLADLADLADPEHHFGCLKHLGDPSVCLPRAYYLLHPPLFPLPFIRLSHSTLGHSLEDSSILDPNTQALCTRTSTQQYPLHSAYKVQSSTNYSTQYIFATRYSIHLHPRPHPHLHPPSTSWSLAGPWCPALSCIPGALHPCCPASLGPCIPGSPESSSLPSIAIHRLYHRYLNRHPVHYLTFSP